MVSQETLAPSRRLSPVSENICRKVERWNHSACKHVCSLWGLACLAGQLEAWTIFKFYQIMDSVIVVQWSCMAKIGLLECLLALPRCSQKPTSCTYPDVGQSLNVSNSRKSVTSLTTLFQILVSGDEMLKYSFCITTWGASQNCTWIWFGCAI